MPRLTYYPIADSFWLVVAAALVLVALLLVGPAREKARGGRRAALVLLRLGVIALVVMMMLRPTWVYTRITRQAATLVVLVDQSRSLGVRDEAGGRSRFAAVRTALAGAEDAIRDLADEIEVKAYTFDAELHAAEIIEGEVQLPDEPAGEQTAMGSALEDVLRREAGKRLLGVVLLGDGAQRAMPPRDVLPQTAAGRLKRLGCPLYTVRFGKSRGLGQTEDVAVAELFAADRVFVKNQLAVTGQVRVDGYVNRDVPVELLAEKAPGKMETVDAADLEVTADGQRIPVELVYVPELPGEVKITLRAAPREGERTTTNNELSTFVNVLAGGLKVLYLEGALRPEIKYLRWALDASPDVGVDYFLIDARRPETRPKDLAERLTPGKYDVYILGDLDAMAFADEKKVGDEKETYKLLGTLAETVRSGAGLMMLGGFHSFGPGGYAKTPLAGVLPIEMDPQGLDRQNFGEAIREDVHLQGPAKMVPTQVGLSHFALQLARTREETAAVWAGLPPLEGANRFEGLKPGALTLAETPAGEPLLASHIAGRGRVLAFAGDSTWRWWMRGQDAVHRRFWRQVVLWLARKDDSLAGNVWIKLRQRRFGPGQRVEFEIGADDSSGGPVEGANYEVQVVTPKQEKRTVPPVRAEGRTTATFRETQEPGDYTIRVSANRGEEALGSTEARFLVFEQDLELDNAAADATLLSSLATMTGGEAVAPEELSSLVRRLAEETEGLEVREETKQSLWDTWTTLFLVVGLLGVEWFLRKRWGLV